MKGLSAVALGMVIVAAGSAQQEPTIGNPHPMPIQAREHLESKASNGTAGRCLFFFREQVDETTKIVALLFYKKESQEAPRHIIATARKRMADFRKQK